MSAHSYTCTIRTRIQDMREVTLRTSRYICFYVGSFLLGRFGHQRLLRHSMHERCDVSAAASSRIRMLLSTRLCRCAQQAYLVVYYLMLMSRTNRILLRASSGLLPVPAVPERGSLSQQLGEGSRTAGRIFLRMRARIRRGHLSGKYLLATVLKKAKLTLIFCFSSRWTSVRMGLV